MFSSLAARRGLSLTEVLIAMFVMAIGMISLLVLFPVGIINTKWALQDGRVAIAANNANSQGEGARYEILSASNFSLRTDPVYRAALRSASARFNATAAQHPFFDAAAGGGVGQWKFGTDTPGGAVTGPYPPIFVDPMGASTWSPALDPNNTWFQPASRMGYAIGFGGQTRSIAPPAPIPPDPNPSQGVMRRTRAIQVAVFNPTTNTFTNVNRNSLGLPRVYPSNLPVNPIVAAGEARRQCILTDDITFEEQGRSTRQNVTTGSTPDIVPESPIPFVQRELRYSWSYMCRWPRAAEPNVVDMSVVVYASRPTSRTAGNAVFPPGEASFLGLPGNGPVNGVVNGVVRNNRIFMQGSNEVVIRLPSNQPSGIRRGEWILDNTLIMPTAATSTGGFTKYAPFSERIVAVPSGNDALGNPFTPAAITTGIANGHFYNVVRVSDVLLVNAPGGPIPVQVLEISTPAKADGYEMVHMQNVADVIEKSSGKLPTR